MLGYGMNPEPLLLGGTGSMSESVRQPDMLPDRYESGTVNLPGIAGLYAGVKFVRAHRAEIEEYELALCDRLRARLREIPGRAHPLRRWAGAYGDYEHCRAGA